MSRATSSRGRVLSNEELRNVALEAKTQYERLTPPGRQEEPSEHYKRWLLNIGFSEEEVSTWRSQ